MNYYVMTLFPEMIEQGMNTSIIGRAMAKGLLTLTTLNIREHSVRGDGRIDDYPYGGGAGMVMQAEPVCRGRLPPEAQQAGEHPGPVQPGNGQKIKQPQTQADPGGGGQPWRQAPQQKAEQGPGSIAKKALPIAHGRNIQRRPKQAQPQGVGSDAHGPEGQQMPQLVEGRCPQKSQRQPGPEIAENAQP